MKLFVFSILVAAAHSLPTANLQGELISSALDLRSYHKAKRAQFPWQAELFISDGNSWYTCGGSLLRKQWVLTAAHCLVKLDFVATEITISLGMVDTRVTPVLKFITNSSNYFIHNKYNEETLENDIALIKLSVPVNDMGIIESITLGWGHISNKSEPWATEFLPGGATPHGARYMRLYYTDVKIRSNFQCRKEFNLNNLPDSIVCGTPNYRFIFSGAGSALIMLDNGKFKQYGVSRSNLYNNSTSYTSTFTRISYCRDWITQTIEREE